MNRFALIRVKEVSEKVEIFKLSIDGKCLYDEFEKECKKNGGYTSELVQIQTRLKALGENNFQLLPANKFKELKGRKSSDGVKDYEIRTKNLRVYLFTASNSKIIVFGAFKKPNKQKDKDIPRMRRLKIEYLKSV